MKKGATRLTPSATKSFSLGKWAKPISVAVTTISIMVAVSVLVLQLANKPINKLELNGSFQYLTGDEVKQQISSLFPSGFVSLDVDEVRTTLELLPLVATARVEKSWSGTLIVTIEEEVPVAIWNDGKLLSQNGDVLPVEMRDLNLPKLTGDVAGSRKVMEHFLLFNKWAKRHGLSLTSLASTPSGWKLSHESDLVIWLDGSNAMKGLKQLESVIEQIQLERIGRIDMRYEQGFAVAWKYSQAQVQG